MEDLKVPKKVKKTKLLNKIKGKNRPTVKERDKLTEKIELFNEQLMKVFSDYINNEKLGMIVFTNLVNEEDLNTFIDEENKERMVIDWGSEFSDSDDENFYENIVIKSKSTLKKRKKSKLNSSAGKKALKSNKLDNTYYNLDFNQSDATLEQDKPLRKAKSNWSKMKELFKKRKDRGQEEEKDRSMDDEPIYEEIFEPKLARDQKINQTSTPKRKSTSKSSTKSSSPQGSTGFVVTATTPNVIPSPPPMPDQFTTITHSSPTKKKTASSSPPMPKQPYYANITEAASRKPSRPLPPLLAHAQSKSPETSLRSRKKRTSPRTESADGKLSSFKNIFRHFKSSDKSEKDKRKSIKFSQKLLKDKRIGKMDKK